MELGVGTTLVPSAWQTLDLGKCNIRLDNRRSCRSKALPPSFHFHCVLGDSLIWPLVPFFSVGSLRSWADKQVLSRKHLKRRLRY